MTPLQIFATIVGATVGFLTVVSIVLGVARVWFRFQFAQEQQAKEDKARDALIEKNRAAAAADLEKCRGELAEYIDEVKASAQSTDREVTGTHNAARVKMAGEIETIKETLSRLATKESVEGLKSMIVDLKATVTRGKA